MKKLIVFILMCAHCYTPVLAQYTGGSGQGYAMSNTILNEVLPVEWLNFGAVETDEGIALHWTTASEKNNDRFEVQHAVDGLQFQTIDEVDGHGTKKTISSYSYIHTSPARGVNYYRLRQVDFDGQSELSAVVSLMYAGQVSAQLHLYPNPATTHVQVVLPHAADARLSVYDARGRRVRHERISHTRQTSLDVSTLPGGLYLLVCELKHMRLPARFVVQ